MRRPVYYDSFILLSYCIQGGLKTPGDGIKKIMPLPVFALYIFFDIYLF